jgi:hypothetical protein
LGNPAEISNTNPKGSGNGGWEAGMASLISIAEIARLLADRMPTLAAELLPNGRREGAEWRVGSLNGEPGRSLAVHLSGSRAGVWKDFAGGQGGDALDLVAQVHFGGDKGRAVEWSKRWLGIDDRDPAAIVKVRREAARIAEATERASAQEAARTQERVQRIWLSCQRDIRGTHAEAYLRARSIDVRRLPKVPGALAFHPELWCGEGQERVPALVGGIFRRGALVGVHRTFLDPVWPKKLEVTNPKLSLGRYGGGCIPLTRGMTRIRWNELWNSRVAESLIVAEGIETALSVALALPRRRVAAAVSLANMAALDLPPCITAITIAADNDTAEEAKRGLDRAIAAHQAKGRTVYVARAAAGKDFNDWLRELTSDHQVA